MTARARMLATLVAFGLSATAAAPACGRGDAGAGPGGPAAPVAVAPAPDPASAAAPAAAKEEAVKPTTPSETAPPSPRPAGPARRAAFAGSWYPGTRAALTADVDAYLQAAAAPGPAPLAVIAPHAGYRYSGAVAGYAYRALQARAADVRRVVLLGPSHRHPTRKVALPTEAVFETPLGPVALDEPFLAALAKDPLFERIPAAHSHEHSVEIQIPFVQRALAAAPGPVTYVPLVVGQLDTAALRHAAAVLRPLLDAHTVVVVSSDFTHYGENFDFVPFRENVQEQLKALDMRAYERIAARDLDGLMALYEETGITVCGIRPIGILLGLLPADAEARLLRYDTSGRMTSDDEHSVSYLAVAFSGSPFPGSAPAAVAPAEPPATAGQGTPEGGASGPAAATHPVSATERQTLLKIARAAIVAHLTRGRDLTAADLERDFALTPRLKEASGAFVTLEKYGELRGCIGEIPPRRPLYLVVAEHAVDAAVNDPRFPPVTAAELSELHIEISVLTPPEPVPGPQSIVIGRHGVYLLHPHGRAVFLPQVAPEQGWDVTMTLRALSRKAGLALDAWKDPGTRFEVFEAVVFEEPKH